MIRLSGAGSFAKARGNLHIVYILVTTIVPESWRMAIGHGKMQGLQHVHVLLNFTGGVNSR